MTRPDGPPAGGSWPDGIAPAELPPDLTALQATDALLDRLGARAATSHDLHDPLVALLASLADEVDAGPAHRPGDRAVVAPRPEPASSPWPADAVFPPHVPRTRRAGAHRREAASRADRPAGGWAARAVGAGTARLVRVGPMVATAAAVLIAFGIGGAITGDPMRPLSGVISLLSPQDTQPVSVASVEMTIARARTAASNGQVDQARRLLHDAETRIDAVPGEDAKARLRAQIAAVQAVTGPAPTPAAPLITATPPPGVVAVSPTDTPTTDSPTTTGSPTDPATSTPTDSTPPTESTPPTDTPTPTVTDSASSAGDTTSPTPGP